MEIIMLHWVWQILTSLPRLITLDTKVQLQHGRCHLKDMTHIFLSMWRNKLIRYPFFHVYFNGFFHPSFNFLFHPWRVASTDNILCKNAEIANFYWLRTIFDTDLQYWPIKAVVTFSEPFFGLWGWPQ